MGLISVTLPTIGDPNSTEDVDIRNSLATFQTLVNGNIDNANLAAAANISASKLGFIPLISPGGALSIRVGNSSLTVPNGVSGANISVTHNLGATPQFAAAVNMTGDTGTYHGSGLAITARAINTMTVEAHNYENYSSGVVVNFLWVVIG